MPTSDLDQAIRDHIHRHVDDDEITSDWILVAGTRTVDGNGRIFISSTTMPTWVASGLLSGAEMHLVEGAETS